MYLLLGDSEKFFRNSLLLLSFLAETSFTSQNNYTHTHNKTQNNRVIMPEIDTHTTKHRYEQIGMIIAEIVRIVQLKNCKKDGTEEYVFTRATAEKHIRKWYAEQSICQAVTQRDRIQSAWTRYDYAVLKKAEFMRLVKSHEAVLKKAIIQEASQKPIEYENPEELV